MAMMKTCHPFARSVRRRVSDPATGAPASALPSLSLSVGGLVLTNRSSTGVVASYAYDGLGRTASSTDGRGNATAYSYDACGNLVSTTDAAGATTAYAYDPLNRRVSATDPLGNATYTAYDAEDRVIAQWGATYPVLYAYDAFGRLSSLSTFRDAEAGGTQFIASAASGDTTRWLYDEATGLLTNKLYADGLGPSYSYTDDGRLSTRLWARGILTSYSYDPAGNLTNTTSSGPAANSSFVIRHLSFFSYDRLGRMRSAIVPGVSTNLYSYSLHGQLTNEIQNGVSISRSYDALARPAGCRLMHNGGASPPGEPFAVTYAYDALGRMVAKRITENDGNIITNGIY